MDIYSEGDDMALLELREIPSTPVQMLYVHSSKLEDAAVAETPEALSTYENEEGTTFGRLFAVCGDESTSVSVIEEKGDQQQYLKLMDEMLRPMRRTAWNG